jgi:hypothetical protein
VMEALPYMNEKVIFVFTFSTRFDLINRN